MNNAINEIKNTLEGTNSRIKEAEDRISEVEDRMMEINEAERKKELKEIRITSEISRSEEHTSELQSHPQLGIVFALPLSLYSFWSYFSTDLQ